MSAHESSKRDQNLLMRYESALIDACRELGCELDSTSSNPEYYCDMIHEAISKLQGEKDDLKRQVSSFSPKGKVILCEFESYSLLFDPSAMYHPFIVAFGYDKTTGEWSQGKYFSDLGQAYDYAHPNIIQTATIKWCREDIGQKLREYNIQPSMFNIDTTISPRCGIPELGKALCESSVNNGYDLIDNRIQMLKNRCLYD